MQIKTILNSFLQFSEWLRSITQTTKLATKDVEQREFLFIAGETTNFVGDQS